MEAEEYTAFEFNGTWKEYAPIAFTNLLLTIVTLGFYRFWGTTRTRQYLWSKTRFIDDQLEWQGTGFELFKGFIMAILFIVLPLFVIQQTMAWMTTNGMLGAVMILTLLQVIFLYSIIGVAVFRGLRYQLTRTYWRGIRGGSNDNGLAFGWSYCWKNFVGAMTMGLRMPWAMTSLWNERWDRMSFGPYEFNANGSQEGLMGRWLAIYAAAIAAILMVAGAFGSMIANLGDPTEFTSPIDFILGVLGFYLLIGVASIAYYAKFYRQMVGGMELHTLSFSFSAKTMDWVKLLLGDVALVILTFGIGSIFLSYRHWAFFIRYIEGHGEIYMDDLTQSDTAAPTQGEGLLDAFDMGSI